MVARCEQVRYRQFLNPGDDFSLKRRTPVGKVSRVDDQINWKGTHHLADEIKGGRMVVNVRHMQDQKVRCQHSYIL